MKLKILAIAVVFFSASAAGFSFDLNQGKGAIVQLSGNIQSSSSGSALTGDGGITPGEVRDLNEKVEKENYDAVVYEINSGGGTVVASKEIMREIDSMEIPTVCRFRDVAASGAYLFSLGCDHVVADSASITGSIGVRSSYLEFSEAMNEYGINYVNITSGEYKDVGSRYMNATEEDKEILQEKADKIHQQFLEQVQSKRNLTQEEYEEVSTGVIFLGSEAENVSLVDELGGRQTAFDTAEKMTGKDLKFSKVETQSSFSFTSLLASVNLGSFLSSEVPLKAAFP